jgi:CheY-like chemotaxis protein
MKPTVLVIDDNPTNLKLARWVLAAEGFEVISLASAEEAMLALQTGAPDLILVDIALPGLDGLELTRRLRANPATRHIAVVAVTAFAMKGDEAKALEAGCDAYLAKPVDTRALGPFLRRVIASSKLRVCSP